MIEFLVLIILVIAFCFMVYPIVTVPTFLINVGLFAIIAIRANIDLHENKMHLYYLWGAFFTAVIIVARDFGFLRPVFDFFFSSKILYITQVVIILFLLSHLSMFCHHLFKIVFKKAKNPNHSV